MNKILLLPSKIDAPPPPIFFYLPQYSISADGTWLWNNLIACFLQNLARFHVELISVFSFTVTLTLIMACFFSLHLIVLFEIYSKLLF